MQRITSSTAFMTPLGLVSLLAASCGSLEPLEETKKYTGGPIKLERPDYSSRPYRQSDTPSVAPLPEAAEPVQAPINTAPVSPSIFHTPDDLALPTDHQVSDGL